MEPNGNGRDHLLPVRGTQQKTPGPRGDPKQPLKGDLKNHRNCGYLLVFRRCMARMRDVSSCDMSKRFVAIISIFIGDSPF